MDFGYAGIMLVAVATAAWCSRRAQQPLGLDASQRIGLGFGAFCGAMLGAKLPFALLDLPGLLTGAAWFDNGKTIVFGLVGGYFGVEVAKRWLGIRIKTGDSFAVPVAAAVAVGRLACFHAGCCHGTPTGLPWGVDFGDGTLRHPTQLYEFVFHAACAVMLGWLARRGWFRGQLIKLYIISYLVYRFASEAIRPEPRLWLDLSVYQWAALVQVPVFAWLWWRDRRALLSAATVQQVEPSQA